MSVHRATASSSAAFAVPRVWEKLRAGGLAAGADAIDELFEGVAA